MTEPRASATLKEMSVPIKDLVIGIKGAGEMATGLACRLFNANLKHIFMMETEHPLAVRRTVSFCEAVHDETVEVEGVRARKVVGTNRIPIAWQKNEIPVIVDPDWSSIRAIHPHVVIDAIIAKKNLGTRMTEAPLTIGLGPGFTAGEDVHRVIETNRGHNLGRVIKQGSAEPNTGIPGVISGVSKDRVLRSPCSGTFNSDLTIGRLVELDQIVGYVDQTAVPAKIAGMIRGLIRNGSQVPRGLKIGDIDPRGPKASHTTISEKARAVGGAVLEAILAKYNKSYCPNTCFFKLLASLTKHFFS